MIADYGCERCGLRFPLGRFVDMSRTGEADARLLVCGTCGTSHQARASGRTDGGKWRIYGKALPEFRELTRETLNRCEKDEAKHKAWTAKNWWSAVPPFLRVLLLIPSLLLLLLVRLAITLWRLGGLAGAALWPLPKSSRLSNSLQGYDYLGEVGLLIDGASGVACRHCGTDGPFRHSLAFPEPEHPLKAACPHCRTVSLWYLDGCERFIVPNGRAVTYPHFVGLDVL